MRSEFRPGQKKTLTEPDRDSVSVDVQGPGPRSMRKPLPLVVSSIAYFGAGDQIMQ